MLISLTWPLAPAPRPEDGPEGAATEVTNGKMQPWACCGQAGLGLVDPGSTFLAGRWGQPQADAWPTCADGASRRCRVGVAGPSSERPEWEKGQAQAPVLRKAGSLVIHGQQGTGRSRVATRRAWAEIDGMGRQALLPPPA